MDTRSTEVQKAWNTHIDQLENAKIKLKETQSKIQQLRQKDADQINTQELEKLQLDENEYDRSIELHQYAIDKIISELD